MTPTRRKTRPPRKNTVTLDPNGIPDCGYAYINDTRMGYSPRDGVMTVWPCANYPDPDAIEWHRCLAAVEEAYGREVVPG